MMSREKIDIFNPYSYILMKTQGLLTRPFKIYYKKFSNRKTQKKKFLTHRFLYISRKVHPSTLQIGPYSVSRRSDARDMSVERGTGQMVKSEISNFFVRKLKK
jgi:hypothetical protein